MSQLIGSIGSSSRATVLLAVIVAFAAGYAVHARKGADPRLDQADDSLEKAAVLLSASVYDGPDAKIQRAFDRHVGKAVAAIDQARAEIAAATAVVDGSGQ